jgi:hypothetical protein
MLHGFVQKLRWLKIARFAWVMDKKAIALVLIVGHCCSSFTFVSGLRASWCQSKSID